MSTNLLKLVGVPVVGRYPLSAVTSAEESRGILDEMKVGRPQPCIWQPHIVALQPGWKPKANATTGGFHAGATIGDLAYNQGGLSMFNGRVWQDVQGLNRHTLVERFLQLPRLNAAIRQNSRFTVCETTAAGTQLLYTACRACIVRAVKYRPVTADAGETAMIVKAATTVAVGAGVDVLSAGIDLNGAADTVLSGALSAVAGAISLAAGDSLFFVPSGADTAAGAISIELEETEFQESGNLANKDWQIGGTNATNATVAFDNGGGIKLTTTGGAADQVFLVPHADTDQSVWASTTWKTIKRPVLEARFRTGASVAVTKFWFGIRLANDSPFVPSTDVDQILLWYDAAVDAYFHYTISRNNVDVTGICTFKDGTYPTVIADMEGHVVVGMDENYYPFLIVNGILTYYAETAMRALTSWIPSLGVQGASKHIIVRNLAMSQDY